MDIDLSTDLGAFPKLVSAVVGPGLRRRQPARGWARAPRRRARFKREVLSRGFVFMINTAFGTKLRDTQCGFKAISREARPAAAAPDQDTGWFWDTELLLLAAKGGWRAALRPGALGRGHGQPREDRLDGVEGPEGPGAHAPLRLVEGAQGGVSA